MKTPSDTVPPKRGWTDEQVELFVGNLLRYGVLTAAAIAGIGGISYLWAHWQTPPNYRVFHGVPAGLNSIRGILSGALALDGGGIIQVGLLLLIATPVARVALSLFAFAKQGDRTYVVVTAIVLGILLWSFSGGLAG